MTQVGEGPEAAASRPVMTFGAPTLGEILADRYRLEEHINDDSFGRQVWRAADVVLRRPVAVILRYPGGDSAAEMLRSAVAASRVGHANFVGVYDAIDEGHRAYVVREWVDGVSLREYVAQHPLPPARATTVGHAVASAVAAVHATGMAHGNIHPGTVLIGTDGRVVLADARTEDDMSAAEADIRAIGGILYFSLTGRWPRAEVPGPDREDLPEAVRDADGNPTPPQHPPAEAPGQLETLTMDLLDHGQTLPSADVLAAELGRLDTEAEFEATMDGGYFDSDSPVPFGAGPVAEPHRPAGRKLLVGVVTLLLVASAGLFLATRLLSGEEAAGQPGGQPGVTGTATSGPTAGAGEPLKISANQVRVIDPPKGDGTELRDIDKTVDGELNTVWRTDRYDRDAKFGGLKPGMGILIDLGEARKVQVEVVFDLAGASAELRTGNVDYPATRAGDDELRKSYVSVQEYAEHNGTKMVFNTLVQPTRYLLIWITALPKVDDGPPPHFQVGVEEIRVYPR